MKFRRKSKIIIQNGINVKEQKSEFAKGNFFAGSNDTYNTYLTGTLEHDIWKISFVNIKTGKQYRLKFIIALWIGREEQRDHSRACFVIKNDLKISKSHCVIYDDNGHLYIEDLGSKNHTYLNGKRVVQTQLLKTKDVIQIGSTVLKTEFGRG